MDVSIENVGKDVETVIGAVGFKLKDSVQGYSYEQDYTATSSLGQAIGSYEKLQPGDKIRGKLAFEVPKDAKNLQLIFDFDIFGGAQAKFNLKKV